MPLAEIERPPAALARFVAEAIALENAAVTRLLEHEAILDYSGHVSTRIPGKEALVIQVGSASRAEVTPKSMLVVSFDGQLLAGDGQPPSELPIHVEILKTRPDVQSVLHAHMALAIAFTMMEGSRSCLCGRGRRGGRAAFRPIPIQATSSSLSKGRLWRERSARITLR